MRAGRATSFVVALALAVTCLPGVVAAQDAIPFRGACHLADDAAVSAALGTPVTGDDAFSIAACLYSAGDTTVAQVSLQPDIVLATMRLALGNATDATIAGRAALTSAGDASGSLPPTVVVALDDGGVLLVQVMTDAGIADPVPAAVALAETLFVAGPITAHQAEGPSGAALAFPGAPCDIVTLAELSDIVGKTFKTAEPDMTGGGCTYNTDPNKDPIFLNVALNPGTLSALRTGKSTDLTVAGRTAIYRPDMSGLFVDGGGGKVFQVLLFLSGSGKKVAKKTQADATAIAELALGRMVASTATPTPELVLACPLLTAEALNAATGRAFEASTPGTEEACFFTTTDQAVSAIVGVADYATLDEAWAESKTSMTSLGDPTQVQVAGRPAYAGQTPQATIAMVDLDGLDGWDGKILGVILLGVPAEASQLEAARQVLEAVLAAH